jgi:hypothetical protein
MAKDFIQTQCARADRIFHHYAKRKYTEILLYCDGFWGTAQNIIFCRHLFRQSIFWVLSLVIWIANNSRDCLKDYVDAEVDAYPLPTEDSLPLWSVWPSIQILLITTVILNVPAPYKM